MNELKLLFDWIVMAESLLETCQNPGVFRARIREQVERLNAFPASERGSESSSGPA